MRQLEIRVFPPLFSLPSFYLHIWSNAVTTKKTSLQKVYLYAKHASNAENVRLYDIYDTSLKRESSQNIQSFKIRHLKLIVTDICKHMDNARHPVLFWWVLKQSSLFYDCTTVNMCKNLRVAYNYHDDVQNTI